MWRMLPLWGQTMQKYLHRIPQQNRKCVRGKSKMKSLWALWKHLGFMYPCREIQGDMSGQKCFWVLPASPANPERASEDRSRNSDAQAWLRPFHTDLVLWFSSCQSYLTFHELQNILCLLKQDVVGFFFFFFLWNSLRETRELCVRACVCVLWLRWALIRSETEGSFYYNLIRRRERHTYSLNMSHWD